MITYMTTIGLIDANERRLGGVMLPTDVKGNDLFAKVPFVQIPIIQSGIIAGYRVQCSALCASAFVPVSKSVVDRGQAVTMRFVAPLLSFRCKEFHGV